MAIPDVSLVGYSILPNHLHLILEEIIENGISRLMHKCSMAYSKFINAKYKESGCLFQGRFRSRIVDGDEYLRYLAVYVMVKNPFELYPGGLGKAIKEFDQAYEWAVRYPFCSLADYAGKRSSPLLTTDALMKIFGNPKAFKEFARECMLVKLDRLLSTEFEI